MKQKKRQVIHSDTMSVVQNNFLLLIQASEPSTTYQLSIVTCVNANILLPKRK